MPRSPRYQTYGPVAIVTGASSGIGQSFARLLGAEGFDLILCARRGDRLATLAEELRNQQSVSVQVVEADLGVASGIEKLIQASGGQEVGLLVSNAGFGLKGSFTEHGREQLLRMVQLNCIAPMLLAHHFIPRMRHRERAGILITGSVEGLMGFPHSAAYAATKAFVKNLGESLWAELEADNIDTLVLAPGSTDTEAIDLQGVDRSKLAGVMSPDEVAQIGLDNLGQGPTIIAGEENTQMFEGLAQMPRRDALRMMAQTMADSLLPR